MDYFTPKFIYYHCLENKNKKYPKVSPNFFYLILKTEILVSTSENFEPMYQLGHPEDGFFYILGPVIIESRCETIGVYRGTQGCRTAVGDPTEFLKELSNFFERQF